MTVVFENYRGFDISDKIQAMRLDDENIHSFFKTLRTDVPEVSTVELRVTPERLSLEWEFRGIRRTAEIGDYIVKDPADGYLSVPEKTFNKNFARDV